MRTVLLILALASCALTERHVIKRCPSTQAALWDYTISATALVLAALAHRNEEYLRAGTLGTAAGGLIVGSALSECRGWK